MTKITFDDILGIIIVAALGSYFIVGFVVYLFVISRRPKRPDQLLPKGMLWEAKDHEWNMRWWFLILTSNRPLLMVIHVLIWPFWFMAYLDSMEVEEENKPEYHGPTKGDGV